MPQPCDHCQGARSIRCLLLPDCPLALAACLCMRCAQTNRHVPPCAVSETSHMARELFAPVGGRALGLRSEGSWLAAELLRAGLEPGAVDRRAGWTGLCPSNDQPSPRCAPAVPLPARPACAAARTRTSTLPVPPHHRPICPLVSQLTPVCPRSCRARRGLSIGRSMATQETTA